MGKKNLKREEKNKQQQQQFKKVSQKWSDWEKQTDGMLGEK